MRLDERGYFLRTRGSSRNNNYFIFLRVIGRYSICDSWAPTTICTQKQHNNSHFVLPGYSDKILLHFYLENDISLSVTENSLESWPKIH